MPSHHETVQGMLLEAVKMLEQQREEREAKRTSIEALVIEVAEERETTPVTRGGVVDGIKLGRGTHFMTVRDIDSRREIENLPCAGLRVRPGSVIRLTIEVVS